MERKMYLRRFISTLPLFLLFISNVNSQPNVFDITKEGAVADGKTDCTQAVQSTWQKACAAGGTIIVPKGTFALGLVHFDGPCKGPIQFIVQGTFQAPPDPAFLKGGNAWVNFDHVDRLTLSGGGTFDGQGQMAWEQNDCVKKGICVGLNFNFNGVTNSQVQGITSLNSKNFHGVVLGCTNVTFQGFTSIAPADSPNTDGLHIARSKMINIIGSSFGTGDDCISIGDGAQQVNINGVTCGPGHGISIGSLGYYPDEQPVSGIHVQNVTISETQNGLRIKSWPAKNGGSASDIHFQDITMNNVQNPVIIDQQYCPNGACRDSDEAGGAPSKVKIQNVTFQDIKGTSATPIAVQLACSSMFPCSNVQLNNIALAYKGGAPRSHCSNVNPTILGTIPPGC